MIGAEKLSSMVDWEDRNTCVLFGDGAGAVVVTILHCSAAPFVVAVLLACLFTGEAAHASIALVGGGGAGAVGADSTNQVGGNGGAGFAEISQVKQ